MNDAVEEIKQKLDIVSFIGQYTKLTKAGRTMRGICPFHSEKHGSFFVYPESQNWHCFGACNTGGDIFAFVMKKEGLDFKGALELLAEKAGVSLPSQINPQIRDQRERLYEINLAAAQYYHNLL
ncbi:CHC2 zinc finger domain-containing protein, partial [Dehalococcoides mccartyi]|uniref:CHC2 zinc finger domain-containing protein n=1 Tax=Dehalococcoides mccartyi TaxID=61435 RepID=UPI002AFEF00D